MEINEEVSCPTCGNVMNDKFCSRCGEKKIHRHDFTLKHFLEEGLEGLTHFDNKFFRSVKLLFTKPGMLTVEYAQGRRVPYMKPFQLFIVSNLFFFLLSGRLNIFSNTLQEFYHYAPYTNFNTQGIIKSKAPTEETMKHLAAAFNERMASQSKLFVVLFIPMLALAGLVFLKKGKFMGEHLAFSAHFFSFILLFTLLYNYLVLLPAFMLGGSAFENIIDAGASIGMLLILGWYYTKAAKRFYHASTLHAMTGAIVVALLFSFSLMGYRMLLFYKIIHSVQL